MNFLSFATQEEDGEEEEKKEEKEEEQEKEKDEEQEEGEGDGDKSKTIKKGKEQKTASLRKDKDGYWAEVGRFNISNSNFASNSHYSSVKKRSEDPRIRNVSLFSHLKAKVWSTILHYSPFQRSLTPVLQ